MSELQAIEVPEICEPKEKIASRRNDRREHLIVLLSIAALMCSSLDLEFLERLDGMLLYMTFHEILKDAGVALIVLLGLAILWWLGIVLFARIADVVPSMTRRSESVLWRLGLAIPLTYFSLAFLNSVRIRFYPHWHPGISGWLWMGPALILLSTAGICLPELSALQRFCRTRLAPIGWLHLIFAATAIIMVWSDGAYVFQDFARPGRAVAASVSPDVYLITVDALRADDMSLYSYSRPTTPNLERFAHRAFTFDYFFANSNFTTSATISIETGKLPWTHRVFQLGGFLRDPERQQNLAALLRQRGYYTSSTSSNSYASPIQHRTQESYDAIELPKPESVASIWSHYSDLVGLNTLHTLSGPLLKSLTGVRLYWDALFWDGRYPNPAKLAFDWARVILERQDIAQPRFVWIHILPPHDPYLAPSPYGGLFLSTHKLTRLSDFIGFQNDAIPPGVSVADLRARYDESIAYADHSIGDFLEWLDQSGRFDRSVVIVSADHGESFEHNWLKHTGPFLYNGLIRIPLLIHVPGQKQGSRIIQAAEQVDLLPTILDLIGGQPPSWSEGTSLTPAFRGKSLPPRMIFSMNLEANSTFLPISDGTVAVLDDEFKYIDRLGTKEVSLYRYRTDPLEEHNLVESEPADATRFKALLANKLKQVNGQLVRKP
jgi:arylsulfatase A-like enzyme